jgi:hypothetical protein
MAETPILFTTTGSNVIVKDLGIEIVDPAAALDVAATFGYTRDALKNSADLQAAIDGASLTATFDGNAVTNLSDDANPAPASSAAEKLFITVSKTGGFSAGWLRWKDNIETRNSPIIVPFDVSLDRIIVSQTNEKDYDFTIYEDANTNSDQMADTDTQTYTFASTSATVNQNNGNIVYQNVAGVNLTDDKRYAIEVVRIGGTPNPTGVIAVLECTKL